jgi:uncharacterized protein YhaN
LTEFDDIEMREAIEQLKQKKEKATYDFMQAKAEFHSALRHCRSQCDRVSQMLEDAGYSILPDVVEEDVLTSVVSHAKEVTVSAEAMKELSRTAQCLELERGGLERELDELSESKGCEGFKELKDNYLKQQAFSSSKSAVSALKVKLADRKARLCKIANAYELSMTAEKAVELVAKLRSDYSAYVEKLKEIEFKASGMGLPDAGIDSLNAVLAELDGLKGLVKDSPEYLRASWEKVKDEDYGNKLLEIQKKLQTPSRSLEQVERDMKEARERISEMALQYKALNVAIEVMNEAIDELNTEFGPALNVATGKILSAITNGAYRNALVSKELDISVKDGAFYRPSEFLSSGSIDQVYLSLRLALCDVAMKGASPPPAFLDDVLMQYDDERAESCLRFLNQYSKERNRQMLLFTCHGDLVEKAERAGIPVRAIVEA